MFQALKLLCDSQPGGLVMSCNFTSRGRDRSISSSRPTLNTKQAQDHHELHTILMEEQQNSQ